MIEQILLFEKIATLAQSVVDIPDEVFTQITLPMVNLAGEAITEAPKDIQDKHARLVACARLIHQLKKDLKKLYEHIN